MIFKRGGGCPIKSDILKTEIIINERKSNICFFKISCPPRRRKKTKKTEDEKEKKVENKGEEKSENEEENQIENREEEKLENGEEKQTENKEEEKLENMIEEKPENKEEKKKTEEEQENLDEKKVETKVQLKQINKEKQEEIIKENEKKHEEIIKNMENDEIQESENILRINKKKEENEIIKEEVKELIKNEINSQEKEREKKEEQNKEDKKIKDKVKNFKNDEEKNKITPNKEEIKIDNVGNYIKENIDIKEEINKPINANDAAKEFRNENNIEDSKISVNWTKENVYTFLKAKLNLEQNILDKMKNEEIDGDALILLIKNDYKFPDLEVNNRKSILECLEDDMLTFKNNIKENELYKEIYIEEIDKLWKSLKKKLKQLKLGDKLKYMIYLIIKDPPPELEKKNELDDYLNKVIRNEDNINEIQENIKDLLNYDENKLKEKCDEWEIKKDNIFKLKIIIKIIKQNINKSLQKEKINNVDDTEIIKKEKNEDINKKNENISINNNKEEIKKNSNENIQSLNIENKMIKNIEQSINSKESAIIDEKELIESNINEKKELNNFQNSIEDYSSIDDNSFDDKYLFYSVIEVFEYQTSQKEMTYGLKNSVNEFKRICSDFNIKFENECSYIDYNEAKKKEMSSFMIWGNKKGLNQFLKEKNILNSFYDFINKNDEKKACICLCINLSKKLSYLIIWPGKYNYQYSRIEEPNDGILLTLVRYGFSISSNSIVCLSEEEIDNFDFNGYNIFQDNEESAYETETNVFEIKENNEKKFKIEEKQNITETIKEKFKNKRITDVKINQNCLLFYEEVGDRINLAPKKDIKFEKFIKNIKEIDLFFEESFNIPINEFYILINHNSFYIKNNLDNQLDEIIEEIVNIMIKNIFKEIFDKILNKYYLNFICIYCKKNVNEDYLYYNSKKINKIFFHKSCYIENHNLNSNNFNFEEKFQFENFNELQIIIYIDFLLILKFNNKTKYWEGKVFSLYNIESDSLFKEIESIELKSLSISTKFSLAEINEKKYLFAINIKDNNPIISYWEIDSQLSDIYTNYKTILGKENTLNDNYNISSGNCVLNYFYHCFDKYPLLGAIQYNLKNYNKKSLKFGFCIKNKKANTIFELKNYLNELKKICQKKKIYLSMILILVLLMRRKAIF